MGTGRKHHVPALEHKHKRERAAVLTYQCMTSERSIDISTERRIDYRTPTTSKISTAWHRQSDRWYRHEAYQAMLMGEKKHVPAPALQDTGLLSYAKPAPSLHEVNKSFVHSFLEHTHWLQWWMQASTINTCHIIYIACSATLAVTITKVNIHRNINKVNQHSEFTNAAKLKKLPATRPSTWA